MPALVTCRGTSVETQWNVGSDDFVLPAIFVVPVSLLCSILVMSALAALYLSPNCAEGQELPPFLYASLFIILLIEISTAIVETIKASISFRGTIWKTRARDSAIPKFIYARLFLLFLEFVVVVLCLTASLSSHLIEPIDCNSYQVALALARIATLFILIKALGSLVRISFFLDPCGLFTPGLLQHFSFFDSADEQGEVPEHLQQQCSPLWNFRRPHNMTEREAEAALSPVKSRRSRATRGRQRRTPNVVRFWQRQGSISHVIRGGYNLDDIDEGSVAQARNNHIGLRRIQRRLRILCCCLGVGGQRSRGLALEDIARALYTLFDFDEDKKEEGEGDGGEGEGGGGGEGGEGVRLVLSDVIAGFRLVNQYQRRKMKSLEDGDRLEDKFRKVTFESMPANQRPHYQYKRPKQYSYHQPEFHLMVDNMIHYMHHSMGVYGWSLHLFSNLSCGLCQLASKSSCQCGCLGPRERHRRRRKKREEEEKEEEEEEEERGEGKSMCAMAAMRVQTGLEEEDILHLSMDDEIFKAPFAVVLDRKMESVVIVIRGTLSIKDALTDMSYKMQFVEIDGVHETYVHQGMYAAAVEVHQQLLGLSRQEIWQQNPNVDEIELDRMEKEQDKILPKIIQKHKDYQLIVTGHSLGAGVASVLALLLRKNFPDLHCYAFSPPGCVFSYPLARYSKKFTTSLFLGNDVVPRISFRSLLHLKQSVKFLLQNCQKSKFEVLFLPNLKHSNEHDEEEGSRRHGNAQRTKSTYSLPDNFESLIVSENTTDETLQNAVFPITHIDLTNTAQPCPSAVSSRQVSMDFLDNPMAFEREFKEHVKNPLGRFTPTFPPGKLYHLRVNKSASPCCFGYCYPNRLDMERVRNEDLCIIMIDKGAVEDHLPNHVLDSLVMFKEQALRETYVESKVEELRADSKNTMRRNRKARAQTNTQKGWIFPTSSAQSPTNYYESQPSNSTATPDSTYSFSRASSTADSQVVTVATSNTQSRQRSLEDHGIGALPRILEAGLTDCYEDSVADDLEYMQAGDPGYTSVSVPAMTYERETTVEVYEEEVEVVEKKEVKLVEEMEEEEEEEEEEVVVVKKEVKVVAGEEVKMAAEKLVEEELESMKDSIVTNKPHIIERVLDEAVECGKEAACEIGSAEREVKRPSRIRIIEPKFPAPQQEAVSPPLLGGPIRTPQSPPHAIPVRVPFTSSVATFDRGSPAITPLSILPSPSDQPISLPAGPLAESPSPPSSPGAQPISLPTQPSSLWKPDPPRTRRGGGGRRTRRTRDQKRPSIPLLQRFSTQQSYTLPDAGGGGARVRVVTVKPRRGPKLKLIIPAPSQMLHKTKEAINNDTRL